MYALVNFSFICQNLLKLQPYKVATSERIYTVSIGKTNYRHLLKTVIIFEYSALQTQNLYHHACHELKNKLLGMLFLLLLLFITNTDEILEEN